MSARSEVKIPDIGDFKNIPVIEINVKIGDMVEVEQTLITLESDKATLDVPAPMAGRVVEIKLAIGDKVSEGSLVAVLESEGAATAAVSTAPMVTVSSGAADVHAELLVIGAGPGGYTAAFRAADLGAKVVMVERRPTLGGVCLNIGCIPSKALLHAAKMVREASDSGMHGIAFGKPEINLERLRDWKDAVIGKLTGGLTDLAKRRKVSVITGDARFTGPNEIIVTGTGGTRKISFTRAIIAAGSEPVKLPFIPYDDPRVIDSTGALALESVPERLLVVGGGIIGLEMATVYEALGSRVTVVELMDQLIPGADRDLVAPLMKRLAGQFEKILLETKVNRITPGAEGLWVQLESADGIREVTFDKVLVAVGRKPNGMLLGAEAAGIAVNTDGTLPVDRQMRTNIPHIFAIGDVVGQPMLAHKATHEAKVAAEVASGHDVAFDARAIPFVAYTDPEVAWVGLTETQARHSDVEYGKGVFPWAASGRSLSLGRAEGLPNCCSTKPRGGCSAPGSLVPVPVT